MSPQSTTDTLALFDRLLALVDEQAYLTPATQVDPAQREAMREVEAKIQQQPFDAEAARAFARQLHAEGRIDRVMMLSALGVVAAHPAVSDWAEAARLAGEQEIASLQLGGARLAANLASVDRHRGVVAFLMGQFPVALDHFTRALEREHTPENLGNVLCSLLSMAEDEQALSLWEKVSRSYPGPFVQEMNRRINADPDLALLRMED